MIIVIPFAAILLIFVAIALGISLYSVIKIPLYIIVGVEMFFRFGFIAAAIAIIALIYLSKYEIVKRINLSLAVVFIVSILVGLTWPRLPGFVMDALGLLVFIIAMLGLTLFPQNNVESMFNDDNGSK